MCITNEQKAWVRFEYTHCHPWWQCRGNKLHCWICGQQNMEPIMTISTFFSNGFLSFIHQASVPLLHSIDREIYNMLVSVFISYFYFLGFLFLEFGEGNSENNKILFSCFHFLSTLFPLKNLENRKYREWK